jgi:hypothetical protein
MVVTAYVNGTQIAMTNLDNGAALWSGTLNAGQVYSYVTPGKYYMKVVSTNNITLAEQPYGAYTNPGAGTYYHSLYVFDGETGTGVGKLFYYPAIASSTSGGSNRGMFVIFSYSQNSQTSLYGPTGSLIWSGVLNKGQNYKYAVPSGSAAAGIYKIESTGYSSILFDWGDYHGADFAPVFFSLQPIPIYVTQTANPKVISSKGQSTLSVHVNDIVTSLWNADVKFNSSCGSVNPSSAKSDVSGNLITTFNAPTTNVKTFCDVNATARKSGYVPGSDVDSITVNGPDPATLYTYVFANPSVVKSQGTSQLRVMVTDGFNLVGAAQVNLSMSGGSANPMGGFTNANGEFFSTFTAPLTGANQTVVVINADAIKASYQSGQGQTQVTVLPSGTTNPILSVILTPSPRQVLALRTSTINVKVTDGTNPVQAAQVYLNATNGSLNPMSGMTNANGDFQSTFTAPNVSKISQIMIIGSAQKTGYVPGSGQDVVSVLPADIKVNITATPKIIYIKDKSDIALEASNQLAGPIDNASLCFWLTPNVGSIAPISGKTDAQGKFKAVYTPPPNLTYDQTVIIRANLSKPTFNVGKGQVDVKVVIYPVLYVSMLPDKSIVKPGESITVRTIVQNAKTGAPIPNATVNLTVTGGGIAPKQGLTNASGGLAAKFTAPIVNVTTFVNITAVATKTNYTTGNATQMIQIEPSPLPIVKVKTPKGGENWTVNTQHDLWWDLSGGTGFIHSNISYSTTGQSGPWTLVIADLNTSAYKWTVPNLKTTFDAYIKVDAYDSTGASATDLCDGPFTIYNPVNYQRELDKVEVTPSDITVNLKATVQFTAKGYDTLGVEIAGLKFTWAVSTTDLGGVTSAGLYTSSNVETDGEVSATASSGGVVKTGYAHVTISKNAKMLGKVTIAPSPKEMLVNASLLMTATAFDTNGDLLSAAMNWKISGNAGSIAPSTGNQTTLQALLKGYVLITATASYNGLQKSTSINISLVYTLSGGQTDDSSNNKGIDPAIIAGAAVGAIVTGMFLFLFFFYKKKKKRPQAQQNPFLFGPEPEQPFPVREATAEPPTLLSHRPAEDKFPFPEEAGAAAVAAPIMGTPITAEPEPPQGDMKTCSRCKNDVPAGVKFCNECGHKMF